MIGITAPFLLWQQGMRTGMMLWDAQAVMTLRLTGFAGLHELPAGEARRTMQEKPPAFARAMGGWRDAALAGGDLETLSAAFCRPLSQEARANRKRLTRTGRAQ